MNKYLEKIASFREVEHGLHYDNDSGRFHVTAEKEHELNKHLDHRHIMNGVKVFGTLGAAAAGGLGLTVGERSIFGAPRNFGHRLTRGLKGGILGGAFGVATGAALAHAGNGQVHSSEGWEHNRLQSEIARRAHDYRRTTEYQMVHGND